MRLKLVEDVRSWWKLGSVQLAVVAGIVAGIIAANQSLALGLIYFLPEGKWRIIIAAGIGLIVFVIPTVTRLVKKDETDAE